MKPIKLSFHHHCDLSSEDVDECLLSTPFDSRFRKCVNSVRRYFSIYKTIESSEYFRSRASMLAEKKRHLLNPHYKWIIHPFSKFAKWQEVLFLVLWIFATTFGFYRGFFALVFMRKYISIYDWIMLSVSVLLLCDVILKFFVGYLDTDTQQVILDQKQIVRRYLKTYFIFDFIGVFGFFPYVLVTNENWKYSFFNLEVLKVVRVVTVMDSINRLTKALGITEAPRVAIRLLTGIVLLLHWLCCLLVTVNVVRYLVDPQNFRAPHSWLIKLTLSDPDFSSGAGSLRLLKLYLHHVTMVLCHFFGVGVAYYRTRDTYEMLVLSIVVMTGLVTYLFAIVKVLQLFSMVNISEATYEEFIMQVEQHMLKKQFSKNLKKRIRTYYNSKMNKKFFLESKIMGTLTEHLQMEIVLYNSQNLMAQVQIFKGLSKQAAGGILALMKHEVYLPGDMITTTSKEDGSLYFILNGTCEVKGILGREVMHLEDGDHFGDTRDFEKEQITHEYYRIVAIEVTEVFSIERKDIKFCTKTYPELLYKLEAMAKQKVKFYERLVAEKSTDSIRSSDIIEDLRKGRILHRGVIRNFQQ